MGKFIKLLFLLLMSIAVNSRNTCIENNSTQAVAIKAKTIVEYQPAVDENDWILQTRFKY